MITNVTTTDTNIKIYGTLLFPNGVSNLSCYVVLRKPSTNTKIKETFTDTRGYFEFRFSRTELSPGVYMVKFYGNGQDIVSETFEVMDVNGTAIATITASNGNVFKYKNNEYTPASTILKVTTQNIFNPTYTWFRNQNSDPIANATTDILEVSAVEAFIGSQEVALYSCVVGGLNATNQQLPPRTVAISIIKLVDGAAGPGTPFQGEYDQNGHYYGSALRSDIVKYTDTYYRCLKDTPSPAGIWPGVGEFWASIGQEYEAIATGILLTKDATITKVLVMGAQGTDVGIIRSYGASAVDAGDGFYIAATMQTDLRKGLFRVGSFDEVNTHDLAKGILWDGTDLSIVSTYFKLSADGKLWAAQGGFGGSAISPAVRINDTGFNIQSIGYFTGTSKFWDKTFDQLKLGPTDIRGYDITIPNGNFEAQTDWVVDQNTGGTDTGYFVFNNSQYYRLSAKQAGGITRISSGVIQANNPTNKLNTFDLEIRFRSDFNQLYKNVGGLRIFTCDQYGGNRVLLSDKPFVGNVIQLFTIINLQFDSSAQFFVIEFYSNCEAGVGLDVVMILDIDYIKLTKWDPFVEISEKGIYIFKSPSSLVKAGIDTFQIKGGTLEVENIVVKGSLSVIGQTNMIIGAHQHISDAILEGTTNLFFTTSRARATLNNTTPILYNNTTGNISLDIDTNNLKIASNKLSTIQNINTTADVQFKSVTAETFTIQNGNSLGTIYNEVYNALFDIPANVPIVIPNSRTYTMGSNKLLVFVDGSLQVKNSNYAEVSTTTISFNYDLAEGAQIIFIIIGW